MNKVLLSSAKSDYETPLDFFNTLDDIFSFHMDLAASNYNTKCKKYFDKYQDGLKQNWSEFSNWLWLNPPYGREISTWIKKAYTEYIDGANICMLIPSRTDTRWQHDYVFKAPIIIFLKGRLKFGNEKNTAPFPSQIVLFGNVNQEILMKIQNLKIGFILKKGS